MDTHVQLMTLPLSAFAAPAHPVVFAKTFEIGMRAPSERGPVGAFAGVMVPGLPPEAPINRSLLAIQAGLRDEYAMTPEEQQCYLTRFLAVVNAGRDGIFNAPAFDPYVVKDETGDIASYSSVLLCAVATARLVPVNDGMTHQFDYEHLLSEASSWLLASAGTPVRPVASPATATG